MFREIGAVLVTLGALFMVVGMWKVGAPNTFLFQMLSGPVFIYLGLQLLK